MKIICIIEARTASSRLPGKVLLQIQGNSILELLIERLKRVKYIDEIVVATTINKKDDIIENICRENSIKFFRGSEEDVMGRVIGAADSVSGDLIVEITGDCPLIDPEIVENTLVVYLKNNVDYVSNVLVRTFPDGMDVQVFSLETLRHSYSMTNDKLDREHVTLHIRNNPKIFSRINVFAPKEVRNPYLGLTLDEEDDYILIKKIFDNFYEWNKYFTCKEILDFLNENKELYLINKNVKRKGDS